MQAGKHMNKQDVRLAKEKILKCLTEDFKYGRKKNQAIFDGKDGYAIFSETDLQMVMDKIVLGLYFALDDNKEDYKNE